MYYTIKEKGGDKMTKSKVLVLTQTALMLALLIVWQFISKPFGQIVTGSGVNLILLVSVFMVGLVGGLVVAGISPFIAFTLGIGPMFIQIVPFIAVGNMLLVAISYLVAKDSITKTSVKDMFNNVVAFVSGSVAKFVFFWFGLVSFALPLIPGIKPPQVQVIGAMFTWPQLITALIASALGLIVIPLLNKALKIDK